MNYTKIIIISLGVIALLGFAVACYGEGLIPGSTPQLYASLGYNKSELQHATDDYNAAIGAANDAHERATIARKNIHDALDSLGITAQDAGFSDFSQ